MPILTPDNISIAILIPCHNESITIKSVIESFKTELPTASIYTYDNNSTDDTANIARLAGSHVYTENRQGKGFVIQAMFRDIDADVYIMVDGDGTYLAKDVKKILEPVLAGNADMVIGSRLHETSNSSFRKRNKFGNLLFRQLINSLFRVKIEDLLSGFRAFNRRIIRGTPLFEGGFTTETEMTIKALEQGFRVVEVPIDLKERPPGSHSKISHFRDGFAIIFTIFTLWRDYRPFWFFMCIAGLLFSFGSIAGGWATVDFLQTGEMKRIGAALLAVGLFIIGTIMSIAALLLHTVNRRFREIIAKLQIMADDYNKKPE